MTWSPAARADPAGLKAPRDETRGALYVQQRAHSKTRARFSHARDIQEGDGRGALLCSTARRTRHADGRERRFSHGQRAQGGDGRGAPLCSTARRTRHADGRERRFPHARDPQGCHIWTLVQANGARPRFARPRFPHTQKPQGCHIGPRPTSPANWSPASCCRWPPGCGNDKVPSRRPLARPGRAGRDILRSPTLSF